MGPRAERSPAATAEGLVPAPRNAVAQLLNVAPRPLRQAIGACLRMQGSAVIGSDWHWWRAKAERGPGSGTNFVSHVVLLSEAGEANSPATSWHTGSSEQMMDGR